MGLPVTGILSLIDYYRQLQHAQETGLSEEAYNRQMGELQSRVNTPENMNRFEDNLRDMEYGTIDPAVSYYVGPDTPDSERSRLNDMFLPRRLESIPVESNFTPAQLDALRDRIYGITPEVGPRQEDQEIVRGIMGAGGDYMPRGGGKEAFSASMEDVEQYLRGGIVGRRRA